MTIPVISHAYGDNLAETGGPALTCSVVKTDSTFRDVAEVHAEVSDSMQTCKCSG